MVARRGHRRAAAAALVGTSLLAFSSFHSLASLLEARSPPSISVAQQLEFARKGHVCSRGLFSAAEVEDLVGPTLAAAEEAELEAWRWTVRSHLGEAAAEAVEDIDECQEVLEGFDVAFVQHFNLWRESSVVKDLVTSPRLACTAAALLGVDAVRVYQDSLFVKLPGHGSTRLHADLHMAPFDTNDFVTCWLPLTPVPSYAEKGTGLSFVSGSQRDVALGFWRLRPQEAAVDLEERYGPSAVENHGGLALGDATWHHGWTLHGAPEGGEPRKALAVSFIADGVRVRGSDVDMHTDDEDTASYSDWIKDLEPGSLAVHELLPLIKSSG